MFYSGQLDIIVGAALTENFLQGLAWAGQDGYLNSNKTIWKVDPSDTEVAGFVRRYKEFYQVSSILIHHVDTELCKLIHSAKTKKVDSLSIFPNFHINSSIKYDKIYIKLKEN